MKQKQKEKKAPKMLARYLTLISNIKVPFLLKFGPQSLNSRLNLRGNTIRNRNHQLQTNFANILGQNSILHQFQSRNVIP